MQEQIVQVSRGEGDSEEVRHPAFGVAQVTHPSGRRSLFQSDAIHPECVAVTIYEASVKRQHGTDWVHTGRELIRFEMSASQFASFASSHSGKSTPITLSRVMGTSIPGIVHPESKIDTHKREVREHMTKAVSRIKGCITELQAIVEEGRLSKKDLRQKLLHAKRLLDNLPTDSAYAVTTAQEAIDKMSNNAKIDIEAFFANAVQRVGFNALQEGRLEQSGDTTTTFTNKD